MGLAAAIIIDFRESIDGPAQHRYVDSLPRAKGQVEVEGGADPDRRAAEKAPRLSHATAVQVTRHPRHSYLAQLLFFADILPTYCRQRNGTRRDGRYEKGASGHTGCDTARYNMTV